MRLDSGDLAQLARDVRAVLDEAGLGDAIVFASGGMDERDIEGLLTAGAPIDGFGIGSRLGTVADSPYLDMAYKLVAFDGRPTLKLSGSTAMWPGAKQVWRVTAAGAYARDVLGLAGEDGPQGGEPMLVEVMRDGKRVGLDSLGTPGRGARRSVRCFRNGIDRSMQGSTTSSSPRGSPSSGSRLSPRLSCTTVRPRFRSWPHADQSRLG